MSPRLKARDTTATYCRSYLVTLGLAFAVCGLAGLLLDGGAITTWPWWGFALIALFLLGGIGLILLGLLGPSGRMEDWAEVSSRHEASLIIMVLAYPVYLVLSLFYERPVAR
ncbi:hypothetical protein DT603_12910 [Pseudoxanthomonas gei]|uniref:Transmembrane protein n=1 Tax=Pseudoxanthomonas gei TaxID=1383030 RepID=A0ABX0AKH9_9GAMM|nr:hypothetical protein [Pseudoxanthomonas gei]NDK39743.1 hypothetical protein [Pseudoxanthomonas gei]